jgi:hypothetical protein
VTDPEAAEENRRTGGKWLNQASKFDRTCHFIGFAVIFTASCGVIVLFMVCLLVGGMDLFGVLHGR